MPPNVKPRFLQDEGLYVRERPEVSRKIWNKMENRLFKQEKGNHWFGEDGNLIALSDPIRQSWSNKLDFLFDERDPAIKTVYKKAIKSKLERSVICDLENSGLVCQLDLNISSLVFTHHPLFSREHVLAVRLIQLYDHYLCRQQKNLTHLLSEKLRALKHIARSTETNLNDSSHRVKDFKKQIRLVGEKVTEKVSAQKYAKEQDPLNKDKLTDKQICENIGRNSNILANVYVPIPDGNVLSGNAILDQAEFSSDQIVMTNHEGVGSNIPCSSEEDSTVGPCLLTSGKLFYSVSWAVDKNGITLGPAVPQPKQSANGVLKNVDPWLSNKQKLVEWAKEAQIDPNDPKNTDLVQLMMYASKTDRQVAAEHFRLEQFQEEFNFVTDEEFESSKRFRLLQLRNSEVSEFCGFKQIPLYDREIPDSIFEVLNLARKRLLKVKCRYKLSDIVAEYEQVDTVTSMGGDYSYSGLSKVKDKIFINVFDEIAVDVQEVSGTFRLNTPLISLGYTWKKEDMLPDAQDNYLSQTESCFLSIFVTVDPQISTIETDTEKESPQKPMWLFATNEDEKLLEVAYTYEKHCKTMHPRRRLLTAVIDTEGRKVLATRYIKALPPPQELLQAHSEGVQDLVARFVSLIPLLPYTVDVGDDWEMWFTSEQCIDFAVGTKAGLAVLLCNYFLYMGKKTWLLLGTSVLEGETAYVVTQENRDYVLWNPRTGECYEQFDIFCPLQTADCLISEHNPSEISYRPTDTRFVEQLESRIEKTLKMKLMEWRSHHPTRWHRQCIVMFRHILPRLEYNPGGAVLEEQVLELETVLKEYKVTGFPVQMPYMDMKTVIETIHSTGIHNTEIPGTEFAIAVYIHPYPNNILSLWIYLASLVHHQ
ncbi:Coiled-coil and C2 domain-containing protein 2A [Acipenser ruthenus]|uniref:Coiled-coil and C2 domain-containing protein 2A n=1 Tax=Acipenser ruthenus TaxID=7906 RepID=A0A662YZR7_ACIRT|nr:Coiled-coil and C2 domain-containing protein 2A [Acipenser ruthenus]